jgi:hypothetical protein
MIESCSMNLQSCGEEEKPTAHVERLRVSRNTRHIPSKWQTSPKWQPLCLRLHNA